jgi:hypothetical protein
VGGSSNRSGHSIPGEQGGAGLVQRLPLPISDNGYRDGAWPASTTRSSTQLMSLKRVLPLKNISGGKCPYSGNGTLFIVFLTMLMIIIPNNNLLDEINPAIIR